MREVTQVSVKEYENVWRNSRPLLETADGAMAPWSTDERACHYVDSADYDAIAAELAAYKLEDVQWEQALAKVAGDMDRIVALEAELAEANAGRDKLIGRDVENNLRIRSLEADLAESESSNRAHVAELKLADANLAAELILRQGEVTLRQTAEGYAARNALRVIELEEVLQEMLDVRGVNTQEAYDVRARARKTLGSTLSPIDTSAKPVEESAKDNYVAETPCRIKEHDGAFKCYAHDKSWGAISKPDAPCVGWSTKETKGDAGV